MKNFINTIRNIFKIEELKSRIIMTLGLLLIYRLGSYVVLPGIDPVILEDLTPKGGGAGLTGLIDLFAGGAFSRASVFALGIMPYISASIVVQLMGMVVPSFQKMMKEGESGRNKINQITRYLTIVITGAQAIGFLINLKAQFLPAIILRTGESLDFSFVLSTVVVLTAGTMFVMWLGEKITDRGLGNGISLIIMVGIIARLPDALFAEFQFRVGSGGGGLVPFLIEIVMLAVVVGLTILLVQGTRKIPIQVAKRVVGNRMYGGTRQYIPLKVNAAGVMPIIFAQAIMFLPATVAQFFPNSDFSQGVVSAFVDFTSVTYNVTLAVLIIVFTYFYTSLSVNSNQMSEDLKRNGAFIPGVKPGRKTAEFLDDILARITLPGSIFLAAVAILPAIATIAGVNSQFAQFYGGTSLLIMVGVILDTLQQIESHLLMRHYDGLMKTGRIKGRAAVGAAI
ncbi:MAG: preprotein translocase subunit SecY [Sphingobacteriaceae bacterium]|nr:preprotein translocase subunit SecY [Sphingobacteriaceae bacterium]